MEMKNTLKFLNKLQEMDVPVSNTTRGEAIQQTFRNSIAAQLKEALYKDYEEGFGTDSNIIPYFTREGIILDVPNASVADKTDPNYCTGSISIELKVSIKGLEFDGCEAAENYKFDLELARKKAEEANKKKQDKIERDRAAREAREAKRAKLIEMAMREEEDF